MKIDLTRVMTLDFLIRQKATGSPETLATRLGISRRTLFFTLNFMRDSLNAPIAYNRFRETYFYAEKGLFCFVYMRDDDTNVKRFIVKSIKSSLALTVVLNIEFTQIIEYLSSLI